MRSQGQARVNIIDSYKRTLAYRMVLKRHPIRRNPNYKAALNDNYSLHSLRHKVKRMLHDMNPDSVAHRKARAKVEQCKGDYKDIIVHNQQKIVDIIPKKPVKVETDEEALESRTPTPPPPPPAFRRSTIGPPLRGLALQAQGVTLKMVKEKSWMGTGPKEGSLAGASTKSGDMNPHTKLPPIPVTQEVEAAA